ncbi:zinc finger, RING/FYVE/PHD-type containing protein [Tanacetum coccineum]
MSKRTNHCPNTINGKQIRFSLGAEKCLHLPDKKNIGLLILTITSMSTDIDIHEQYINISLPADIPDNLNEFLPDDEDLTYEEVILQQASVYHSYQESGANRVVTIEDDHRSDSSCSEDEDEDGDDDADESESERDGDDDENEGESTRDGSQNSQEAMDEAYARSLQELGEEFDEFFISEFNSNANGTAESSDSGQDDIDPDNMRYEELLDLTESIGVENVGLSALHISQLPTSIYRSGMLSNNNEEK